MYAGTDLKRLLSGWPFRVQQHSDCSCHNVESTMNGMGPNWCESTDGMEWILSELKKNARQLGVPFSRLIAAAVVRRAISNARRASREREEGNATV
jgi:hypothetical protein